MRFTRKSSSMFNQRCLTRDRQEKKKLRYHSMANWLPKVNSAVCLLPVLPSGWPFCIFRDVFACSHPSDGALRYDDPYHASARPAARFCARRKASVSGPRAPLARLLRRSGGPGSPRDGATPSSSTPPQGLPHPPRLVRRTQLPWMQAKPLARDRVRLTLDERHASPSHVCVACCVWMMSSGQMRPTGEWREHSPKGSSS